MNNNFVTIQSFMLEYGLSSNELIIYAVIYGFSQNECGCFYGSRNYLAKWANCTLPTVDKCLKTLQDKGLIKKDTLKKQEQTLPYYQAIVQEKLFENDQNMSNDEFVLQSEKTPKKKAEKQNEKELTSEQKLCNETWQQYCRGYGERYKDAGGTAIIPIRNAKTNSQVLQIVRNLGSLAPEIAYFYCFHNNEYFILKKHDIGLLLASIQQVTTDYQSQTMTTRNRVEHWVKQNDSELKEVQQWERIAQKISKERLIENV